MKISEVRVGGRYSAKVSNKLTIVRVERIGDTHTYAGVRKRIVAVNEATGRTIILRSAQRLRREVE